MRFAPFTRCPDCGLISQPESADYAINREDDTVNWRVPAKIRCAECGHRHSITETDVLPHDAVHVCSRCAETTSCPAAAARVVCGKCGLSDIGSTAPDIVQARRATEGLRAIEQKAMVQEAKDRAVRTYDAAPETGGEVT